MKTELLENNSKTLLYPLCPDLSQPPTTLLLVMQWVSLHSGRSRRMQEADVELLAELKLVKRWTRVPGGSGSL